MKAYEHKNIVLELYPVKQSTELREELSNLIKDFLELESSNQDYLNLSKSISSIMLKYNQERREKLLILEFRNYTRTKKLASFNSLVIYNGNFQQIIKGLDKFRNSDIKLESKSSKLRVNKLKKETLDIIFSRTLMFLPKKDYKFKRIIRNIITCYSIHLDLLL